MATYKRYYEITTKGVEIEIPPFSDVEIHYGGRDTENITVGGGVYRVIIVMGIIALQSVLSGEIFLVTKDTKQAVINRLP